MGMKTMVKGCAASMCDMMGMSSKPTEEDRRELANVIAANPVVVFSKPSCPYCHEAKSLLDSFGAKYQTIDVTNTSPGLLKALKSETGQKTVPNIFIQGIHVGGHSDLQARKSSLKTQCPNYHFRLNGHRFHQGYRDRGSHKHRQKSSITSLREKSID